MSWKNLLRLFVRQAPSTALTKKYPNLILFLLLSSLWGCPGRPEPQKKLIPPAPEFSDGQNAPFASGPIFIINELKLSDPDSCPDRNNDGQNDCGINRNWQPFSGTINNSLAANVVSGATIIAIEMAGLDLPYSGEDSAVTLRIYSCVDSDSDPTNNLCAQENCGNVLAKSSRLVDGQTPFFSDPEPLSQTHFHAELHEEMLVGSGSLELSLKELQLDFLLALSMAEIQDGQMCGVATAAELNNVIIPLCEWLPLLCTDPNMPQSLSETELLVLFDEQPEIDFDNDGLEMIELDDQTRIARCIDGDGRVIEGDDCLEDPGMVDGYVLCFDFHAVPGHIVGIAEP